MATLRSIRHYEFGGDIGGTSLAQGMGVAGQVAGMIGGLADSFDAPNEYGRQGGVTNVLKSAGTLAAAGSAFGPWGTAAGAAVGVVKGIIDTRKQKEEEQRIKNQEKAAKTQAALTRYSAQAMSNPDIAQGTVGGQYFENGGMLSKFLNRKANGGSLSTLNSNTVEVKGRTHAQGGVDLPTGEEVEDGETITGNYVLSDKLGFAQAHKPIAKAIGILEKKAPTKSVLNSIDRLREKEQALILFQEQYRKQNNLA